ncbi:MAG: VOC family protein [Phycisphaerales bacterium]
MADPQPTVRIALDVQDLNRSCEFYGRALGFRVTHTDRPGLIFESRSLRSDRHPAVQLDLRAGFGKRIQGTSPGGITKLSFREPKLAEAIAGLNGLVRWIGPPPATDPLPPAVAFNDPDAYQIELFA